MPHPADLDTAGAWRGEFPILETCTYLVSHSLGAMPRRASTELQAYADTWARRGVRAWAEGWWELGAETGDLLAPILGVATGSISMHQNATVAHAIVASCHGFDGRRRKVVLSDQEFPSTMYLYEGLRRLGAEIEYVSSPDPVRLPLERFLAAIDDRTLLVPISRVLFKSAHVVDLEAVVDRAHRVGARVVADVYQAAGAMPLDLGRLEVDFAVGGSVKWLCGGPGAGYLYVRPDLAAALEPAQTGWAAHAQPFAFEAGPIRYAAPPERFQSGTPNVPALYAARAGFRIVAEVGVEVIRARSLRLTRRIMDHAAARGYRLNMPTADADRGGTVILDVPGAEGVAQALIAREVIIDWRPGAGIRMAPHFYNDERDLDRALEILDEIVGRVEASPDRGAASVRLAGTDR